MISKNFWSQICGHSQNKESENIRQLRVDYLDIIFKNTLYRWPPHKISKMATLQIRNIPDNLYSQIEILAQEHNRSLDAQVVVLLQNALQQEKTYPDQAKLLTQIRRRRYTYPKDQYHLDSVQMLREDRER